VRRSGVSAAPDEAASWGRFDNRGGSPYREFISDAVLGSRFRPFSDEEIAGLPAGLEFDHGVTLKRARVWQKAIPIDKAWPLVTAADQQL
jgi:hypothetical protein